MAASSARIGVEAGRTGWHAARAAPAACLRVGLHATRGSASLRASGWKARRERIGHFVTVFGAGLPMPRSRHRVGGLLALGVLALDLVVAAFLNHKIEKIVATSLAGNRLRPRRNPATRTPMDGPRF